MKRLLTLAVAALALGACQRQLHPTGAGGANLSATKGLSQLPTGDIAGAAASTAGQVFENPYANDPGAQAEGHRLFDGMNCSGCHGYGLKGGMGPDLTDTYWRYGGTPAAIYQSIYQGRPKGMPAWGVALPPSDIWKLVAYIESKGGALSPSQYQAALQGDVVPKAPGGGGANAQNAGNPGETHAPGGAARR